MKLCLLFFSPAPVAWVAVMGLSSVLLFEPSDRDVARWSASACGGGAFGELALKHWAADGNAVARSAYVNLLAGRRDAISREQRMRMLRDGAVIDDPVSATQLATLSLRHLLNGQSRSSMFQIRRWYQQGARAGVTSASGMLDALTASGVTSTNDLSRLAPWLQRRAQDGDADAGALLVELIERPEATDSASSPPCHGNRALSGNSTWKRVEWTAANFSAGLPSSPSPPHR